jgi:hypothetical protein
VDISLASPFTAGDPSCSVSILKAFVAAPDKRVDASCAATAYTPDVAASGETLQALAKGLYGTETPLLGDSEGLRTKSLSAPAKAMSRETAVATLRARVRQARAAGDGVSQNELCCVRHGAWSSRP